MNQSSSGSRSVTFVLCFLASIVEGYDLQAGGIVMRKLIASFALTPTQTTWVPTANTLGLLIGAIIGGWLADRIGRKKVLTFSMLMFGVFSIATAHAWDASSLLWLRFLVGLGLGGAMPNIISLLAEAGGASGQTATGMIARVTSLAAAIPLGGFFAVALALSLGPTFDWRTIFQVGGWAPIAIAVLMIPLLKESSVYLKNAQSRQASGEVPMGMAAALFGGGRGLSTVLLWISYVATLVILYLLLGWLPLLMTGRGLSPLQGTWVAAMFALGGAVGAVILGVMMRLGHKLVVALTYGCMALGIYALATIGNQFGVAMTASFVVGVFVIGGQYLLYGLAPTYYPSAIRGTGVGTAVSVGRVGAVIGPLLAGTLLAGGRSSAEVIMSIMPAVLLGLVAAFWLVNQKAVADETVPGR
jgi:AAHS family 3-hydroxyphenylpropionic acid transporter